MLAGSRFAARDLPASVMESDRLCGESLTMALSQKTSEVAAVSTRSRSSVDTSEFPQLIPILAFLDPGHSKHQMVLRELYQVPVGPQVPELE